jgi:hypothetical protein
VGWGVGLAVGVGLGLAVGLAVGDADGDADGTVDALADGAPLGLGDGSTADARSNATTRLPLRSWSCTVCARVWILATPWSAVRKAASWADTSSAQAISVVASGPMAAASPFVVYGPW